MRLLTVYPSRWPTLQLAVDGTCVLAMLWLFAFDTSNALWALLVLPVLQAALRSQLRGALITWAVLSVGYVARDVWAAATYPHVVLYPDSITFRLGIVGIVATATGSLAGRLTATAARLAAQVRAYQQALAEVDRLRQVASATRRITSLDADTVVHEVAVAAARIGFGPVRMCRHDGDDRWSVVSADGERRDVGADDGWT